MNRDDDLKEFMMVLKRALLMIVAYIDRRYGTGPGPGS